MSYYLLAANILAALAFAVHTVMGDKEVKLLAPDTSADPGFQKQEKWTMVRCGWHWISLDLLFLSIGLALINFFDYFNNEVEILQLMSIYCFGYGVVWLLTISLSKPFPKRYLKLGQWLLLWVIGGLIFLGIN